MPTITKILEQKRRPNRRNVYLDGKFAFGCNINVVAKFRLREGMSLTDEQVRQIQHGEVRQECFDKAMEAIGSRLGYVDDERFAKTKALSAAQYKHHGRRRAFQELRKAGVTNEVADKALADVYSDHDSTAVARQLAEKQAARLRKLDPAVARRRLVGMLQRRGYDYESIKPVVDDVLGRHADE